MPNAYFTGSTVKNPLLYHTGETMRFRGIPVTKMPMTIPTAENTLRENVREKARLP